MRMDKVEMRRKRLREWFADKTMPPEEKSYLSQLMTGKTSFGEKAARRLEQDLGMGEGYLDRAAEAEKEDIVAFLKGPGIGFVSADEIIEIIQLYKQADSKGRNYILASARSVGQSTGQKRDNHTATHD